MLNSRKSTLNWEPVPLDPCLVLVPGSVTSSKYSGLGILHFKMRELAGWFSNVFLGLTFHDSKIIDIDSFSCCKVKYLTILTWQLGWGQLPQWPSYLTNQLYLRRASVSPKYTDTVPWCLCSSLYLCASWPPNSQINKQWQSSGGEQAHLLLDPNSK